MTLPSRELIVKGKNGELRSGDLETFCMHAYKKGGSSTEGRERAKQEKNQCLRSREEGMICGINCLAAEKGDGGVARE